MNLNYSWLNEWDIKPVAGGQTNQEQGEIEYPENRWTSVSLIRSTAGL